MQKISHAGCLGLSRTISLQFTAEMCVAAKNCEKYTKNPFFCGIQGRSRSSVLINLKSLSPVLVMISSMSLHLSATIFTLHEPISIYSATTGKNFMQIAHHLSELWKKQKAVHFYKTPCRRTCACIRLSTLLITDYWAHQQIETKQAYNL